MEDVRLRAERAGREPQMDVAVVEVGHLMALSARTAPKAAGKDFIDIRLLSGKDVDRLGDAMVAYGEREGDKMFVRDGRGVKASAAVLLAGIRDHPPIGLDCNGCGFGDCEGFTRARRSGGTGGKYQGPACTLRVQDLGIAVGSAVKTAQVHNVDNRIMYRAGVLAIELGLVPKGIALGIPLSATGKSPFFDRG